MRTIKLVVIGSSGVGKTSLRSQYLSGRFTTGYRATIGADFITKTLPHHNDPAESITLQIWDTAGQERFSSLSSAFFRGADAALLMFDVNDLNTLDALHKWWAEFKDRAPLPDEDVPEFCCVVVGNKMDLVQGGTDSNWVSESDALKFIDALVPPPLDSQQDHLSPAIDINGYHRSGSTPHKSRSRSMSGSFRGGGHGGTMSTTRTGFTAYHTPSSSIFDNYESARSSPVPPSRSPSPPHYIVPGLSPGFKGSRRKASSSSSSSSTPTITPSLFARTHMPSISQQQQEPVPIIAATAAPPLLQALDTRPKLFFTSAKTGEGVALVFEYVAQRVTKRWECLEDIEARTLHIREYSSDSVQLGLHSEEQARGRNGFNVNSCC